MNIRFLIPALFLSVWFTGPGGSSLLAQSFSVTFPSDTVLSCLNVVQTLTPGVSGGVLPYQYKWNTGEITQSIDVMLPQTDTVVYVIKVTDGNGDSAFAAVVVMGLPNCVWPGDANGDATANVLDALSIGVAYNHLGPVRPQAHNNWIGQPVLSWSQQFLSGVNEVHADANGDGVVNTSDFTPLMLNYFTPNTMTYAPIGVPGISPPLTVPMPTYLPPNQTIVLPVMLGDLTLPADSVYGIAFSITYDPLSVVPGSVSVAFTNGWLGTPNADLAGIYQVFEPDGQIDIGITRIDHTSRFGAGKIADIIVTIDDVIGKKDSSLFYFVLDRVHVIRPDGSYLPVHALPSLAWVTSSLNALPEVSGPALRVWQKDNRIFLQSDDTPLAGEVWLTDLTGREVARTAAEASSRLEWSPGPLPAGMYVLTANTGRGVVHQWIRWNP